MMFDHDDDTGGGFWGRIAEHADPATAWQLAVPAVARLTGRPEAEAIAVLDSRRGAELAGAVAALLETGQPLRPAITASADRLAERLSREERGDPGRAAPARTRDQDGAIAVARYADHPVFGRLYWYYSSLHLTFADGHGESRDDFHLVRRLDHAGAFSSHTSVDRPLYGDGRHMSFLDHLARVGRAAIGFGDDAEKDELLAWSRIADWRSLPLPTPTALRSETLVPVLITGDAATGFTVDIPGFPECVGHGADEEEALADAADVLSARLVEMIIAGTRLPRLYGHPAPELTGAREDGLIIKTPRARRDALAAAPPKLATLPGDGFGLSARERHRLDLDRLLTGADLGDAVFARGCDALYGHRQSADPAKAAAWLGLAAELGHAWAAMVLGCLYRDGLGVARDGAAAVKHLERSDQPFACHLLGLMYADGDGVGRDDAEAGRWLRRAAAAGVSDAAVRLLRLLEGGRLAPSDPGEPLRCLQRAAALGDRAAHERIYPITRRLMDRLFRRAMAAPPLPSPLTEWRVVRLEEARPPEMPAQTFLGYIAVLYGTQYLEPDERDGFARVWIYHLLERERGQLSLNFAEIARRKPLV